MPPTDYDEEATANDIALMEQTSADAEPEEPPADVQDTELPDEQETVPETDAEPLDAVAAQEGDLYDAEGRILGKFSTPEELAKGYKNLERLTGRKSVEARELRLAMQAAGFTFDADGKPIPPQGKADPAAPQETQLAPSLPPGWSLSAEGQRVSPEGVTYDELGIPVVSDDEWNALYDENPREYDRLRIAHELARQQAQQQRAAQQAQEVSARQQAERAEIVKAASAKLPADLVTKIMAEADKALPMVAPEARSKPGVVNLLSRAAAYEPLVAHIEELRTLLAEATSGNVQAQTKARKVIAFESNGNAAAAPKPKAAAHGLTAEEMKMAKDFGLTYEDYAANK